MNHEGDEKCIDMKSVNIEYEEVDKQIKIQTYFRYDNQVSRMPHEIQGKEENGYCEEYYIIVSRDRHCKQQGKEVIRRTHSHVIKGQECERKRKAQQTELDQLAKPTNDIGIKFQFLSPVSPCIQNAIYE